MPRKQIVTRSSAKINKKQEEDNMQTDDTDKPKSKRNDNVDNVQKKTDKPRKPIITHSSANKVASKLVHKAKIKIKGSWEFVNNERAECAKRQNVIYVFLRSIHCMLWSHILEENTKVTDINVSIVKRNISLVQAEINMKCTTQLVTGLSARIARKGSCLKVNMRSTGVCTLEKTYICRKKGRDKHYGSTRAQNYHERQHNAKLMYCDYCKTPKLKKCNQEFFSKQHYQQHYQGL